jgi:hypothetical protein
LIELAAGADRQLAEHLAQVQMPAVLLNAADPVRVTLSAEVADPPELFRVDQGC